MPASAALSVAQVATMDSELLASLMRRDFDVLVKAAIADATLRTSSSNQRLLRKREWHLAWLDALTYAEGELQVAVEIMEHTGDERAQANSDRLARIRNKLTAARKTAVDYRKRAHRRALQEDGFYDSARTAASLLVRAHQDDFLELTSGPRAALPPSSDDAFDAIEKGCARGWLSIPATQEVDRLLLSSDDAVRQAAAQDAQRQDHRNPALRHPLLLRRWRQSLHHLAEMTWTRALATSPFTLGPLPSHVHTMREDDARDIFNARRFLAAVHQRRTECDYQRRWASESVEKRRHEDPAVVAYEEACREAASALVLQHPAEHAYILQRLAPYEHRPGVISSENTPETLGALRKKIKQELFDANRPFTAEGRPEQ
ncbi:hypothetical protein QFZ75_007978 [Streptomyces sp. V3I8]|uniref:hypothetical protein n=1 Tax=Streptomyces sp. V3I8 TaxID=3042279 RepID=UPI002782DB65|nr:hypothetical protein [Streptomyces sp. V3I8]MDQ1041476.1 hypothetical protein [Streptomyces sp. V3I8]